VTLEFALALPAFLLVLAFAMASIGWALGAARAQQAAGEGARSAIVSDDAQALAVAARVASGPGNGAALPVRITRADGFVTVCVGVPARGLLAESERCATARDAP